MDDGSVPETLSPTDIFIPVMGVTGAGKSTFISLCTDEEVPIGHKLISCTVSPCVYSLRRKGQIVRLIVTPGFDDSKRPDIDILTDLAFWLTSAYNTNPKILLSGIIYLHPIHEPRLQGTARKNLTMFKLLCGDENLHSVVLATTMWHKDIETNASRRIEQLKSTPDFWGKMIDRGSTVFKHDNTRVSALEIIDYIIQKREKVTLSIQKQMVDEHRTIDQTSAGQLQREDVIKEKEKAEWRLRQRQEELDECLLRKENDKALELLEEQEKYTKRLKQKEDDIEALKMSVAQLQKEKEAQMVREQEELEKFMAQEAAKIEEMIREFESLQTTREHDMALVQEKQPPGYGGLIQGDAAFVERLTSKIHDTEIRIQRLSEEIQGMTVENKTLRAQEKKKFAKRGMQFGGGIAAGAAVLCSVM